ncbi:unnamed protein product [Sphenostylis stenocarpa]|uniref:glutathione synthase n=1 Tax=Sphenostylis stenocarpa TaxID=92480 RepID=A0AA86SM05_9FABA|nr:unnamed protein product [Sphenostylis stenocarpa]
MVLYVAQMKEWKARLLMEQSSAIKCPSLSYHLVGTKKIQQELAKPGVLKSRFLENKDDIAKLRKCLARLWSLDESSIVAKAIEKPELFAMKPQREGGGNNIYGDDVREILQKLQKSGSQEDAAYILMQRHRFQLLVLRTKVRTWFEKGIFQEAFSNELSSSSLDKFGKGRLTCSNACH